MSGRYGRRARRAPRGYGAAQMRPITDELSAVERQALEDIAEYGVHIVHVPDSDSGPGFSFTIGLWHQFGQPEVIAFGLPEEVAHELLNAIADEADDGRTFRDGEKHDELLVGYPVRFVAVPPDARASYFGLAEWAYAGEPFECVQLVWPDKQGRWPWDDAVRDGFRTGQPVLGRQAP